MDELVGEEDCDMFGNFKGYSFDKFWLDSFKIKLDIWDIEDKLGESGCL